MVSRKNVIIDQIKLMTSRGFSVIPNRTETKDGKTSGKYPCLKSWSKYIDEVASEEDIENWSHYNNITGLSLIMGGSVGLCCVDIDSYDKEMQERIVKELPYTPLVAIGNPAKGGKFFYRMSDMMIANNQRSLRISDRNSKVVVELLIGKYAVIPPSFHSSDLEGKIYYEWEDKSMAESLINQGTENLPEFNMRIWDKIQLSANGQTSDQMKENLPSDIYSSNDGDNFGERHASLQRYISKLAREGKHDIGTVIGKVIDYDVMRHRNDPYLKDNGKGSITRSVYTNALYLVAGTYRFINAKKTKLEKLEEPRLGYISKLKYDGSIWSEPILETFIKRPDLDVELLPEILQKYSTVLSKKCFSTIEDVVLSMYTHMSSLTQRKYRVSVKINDTWEEIPSLYTCIVKPSGSRKSDLMNATMYPIRQIESGIKEKAKINLRDYQANEELVQIQLKDIDKKIKREIEAMPPGMIASENREIKILNEEKIRVRESNQDNVRTNFIIDSITPEMLAQEMERNKSLYMVKNEFTDLSKNFDKSGYEGIRGMILDFYDGKTPRSHLTKTSGKNEIKDPRMSIYTHTQPEPLVNQMRKIKDTFNNDQNDGLYQRFLYSYTEDVNVEAKDVKFNHMMFQELYDIFHKIEAMPEYGIIKLDKEAYITYMQCEEELLKRVNSEPKQYIRSFLGKATGKLVTLALISEIFIMKGPVEVISSEAVKLAYILMERQEETIRDIFNSESNLDVIKALMMIKEGTIKNGAEIRTLRSTNEVFSTSEKRKEVLSKMVERKMIEIYDNKIKINPYLVNNDRF